jgi:hypothetical protein
LILRTQGAGKINRMVNVNAIGPGSVEFCNGGYESKSFSFS